MTESSKTDELARRREYETGRAFVIIEPTDAEALHAVLNNTPPLREFQPGVPNTYVLSDAVELEATWTESGWIVNSVTTR